MKWFYLVAPLLVIALIASPMLFLKGESDARITEVVTGWKADGSPIIKNNPVICYDTYSAAVRSLDPATCGDTTSARIQVNFYEGLYTYHYLKRPVDANAVIPQLAAAMPEIDDTRTVYTIKLRKGVLYHRNPCFGTIDGPQKYKTREVTAEDFVLAFKRVADRHIDSDLSWAFLSGYVKGIDEYHKKSGTYATDDLSRYSKEDISGVRALDKYTLQIELNAPFPQFIFVLAMNVYAPIPREAVEYWMPKTGKSQFFLPESVVGTGPYLLHTFKTKHQIIMVRNPDFRRQTYPTEGQGVVKNAAGQVTYVGDKALGLLDDAGKTVPFIDVLRYDFNDETFSNWMMFLAKRKDAAGIPRQTFEFVVTPGKDLTDDWAKRHIYMRKSWSPAVYWLAFNMADPVVGSSRSLRQALAMSFDVENYIKVIYNGRGRRATTFVPSTFASHAAAGPGPYYMPVDETDPAKRKVIWDKRIAAAKAKLVAAKEELRQAGQLVDGDIPTLKVDITRGAGARTYAEIIQQQFSKIGLKAEVEYNDWPTLQQKVHKKQTQIYSMGWHADYPDAENFLQLFYSPNIAKQTNNMSYSNPRFDALYEEARGMSAGPARMKLYVEMLHILDEDVPAILLTEPLGFGLYYDWVHNVKSHPIGYGYMRYWRIDEKRRTQLGGRN